MSKRRRLLLWAGGLLLVLVMTLTVLRPPVTEDAFEGHKTETKSGDNLASKQAPSLISAMAEKITGKAAQKEAERLANWKANFPFKKIYHPTLRYDPTIWQQGSPKPFSNDNKRIMMTPVIIHGFLKAFYENPLRYSRQFEQMYHILEEYNRHDDPYVLGGIFECLRDYHKNSRYDPDSLQHTMVYTKVGRDPDTGEMYPPEPIPVDGKTTWGIEAQRSYDGIAHNLHSAREWPGRPQPTIQEVEAIRERLATEIEGMADLKGPPFAYYHDYELELKAGDQLLSPREGWLEDYRGWQKAAWNWEPPEGTP